MTTASSFAAYLSGQGSLTSGAVCDFGLDSGRAFGRLNTNLLGDYQAAWDHGAITAQDLEAASCKGRELTKLLQRMEFFKGQITTVYDNMTTNDLESEVG